jgi:hypothetical protein
LHYGAVRCAAALRFLERSRQRRRIRRGLQLTLGIEKLPGVDCEPQHSHENSEKEREHNQDCAISALEKWMSRIQESP